MWHYFSSLRLAGGEVGVHKNPAPGTTGKGEDWEEEEWEVSLCLCGFPPSAMATKCFTRC